MSRRGFTLVEILVALVVLEVGVLGVVGTLWLAAVTLRRAEVMEAGVAAMERVYDSLQAGAAVGDGRSVIPAGEVWWWSGGSGDLRIEYRGRGDTLLATLYARSASPAEGSW